MHQGQKGTITLTDYTGRPTGTYWMQQCQGAVDGSDLSFCHYPHLWPHPSGKERYCRGWFPKVSVKRGGIKYNRPASW
jgi:hypothetical protein